MRYGYLPASVAAHDPEIRLWRPEPVAPPTHRILVPSREPTAREQQRLPDLLTLGRLMLAGGARYRGMTYAMAEEIATATLVESLSLQFELSDGRRGVALWWDWSWHGAIVRELGLLTRERLELLVTTGSAEVPTFECSTCGKVGLKRKRGGSLYAHKRANWRIPLTLECR